jgi:predicted ATP-binding protein involved in virulence
LTLFLKIGLFGYGEFAMPEKPQIFLTKIVIRNVYNVLDFEIPLDNDERKHLIFTGKNGSGKTTTLEGLKAFFSHVYRGSYKQWEGNLLSLVKKYKRLNQFKKLNPPNKIQVEKIEQEIRNINYFINVFGGVELFFTNSSLITEQIEKGNFVFAYFGAKRKASQQVPVGINKTNFVDSHNFDRMFNDQFIQYIVNLKAERSFARDDKEEKVVKNIDIWFNNFEKQLKYLFNEDSLKLVFDRKNYNFDIVIEGKIPFKISQLSDGYSAILSILTELILKMEHNGFKNYDMQGIVLIDELETHLHVDLQRKVLGFLTSFFPNIQFIITTHSPFILSSISNSIICDLEDKIITKDFSGYTYDALIENYFETSKYSTILLENLERFEKLSKEHKFKDKEYIKLNDYFKKSPNDLSPKLKIKLNQIKLYNRIG